MHIMTTRTKDGHVWHGLVETIWNPELKQSRKRVMCTLKGYTEDEIEEFRTFLRLLGKRRARGEEGKMRGGPARKHGAVSAVLGTAQKIGLDLLLGDRDGWRRGLALAHVVARAVMPAPKIQLERELGKAGASTLSGLLGVEGASSDSVYATMDWMLKQQGDVEKALAARHLEDGALVLYDVSSSYFEGKTCPLAKRGYSRDEKRHHLQVVYGLLCSADGCPVSVEAFKGNTSDPATLSKQVRKITRAFGLKRIALVGDRGMVTHARIREDLAPKEVGWVTALGSHTLRKLAREGALRPWKPSDQEHELATVTSTHYPGERLVVCRNPALALRRRKRRLSLLRACDKRIREFAGQYAGGDIDRDTLNRKLGTLKGYRMQKHYLYTFDEDSGAFSWKRNRASINTEAALDGIYVIRTNVPEEQLGESDAVRAYKSLAHVERAFRSLKSLLRVRPIHHSNSKRVRTHLFICMLAYHVEWHMRQMLAPMLYNDPVAKDPEASPVEPARRSAEAKRRDSERKNDDGTNVYAFPQLLRNLESITVLDIKFGDSPNAHATVMSELTPDQKKAFALLGFDPHPPETLDGTSRLIGLAGKKRGKRKPTD